MTLQIPISFLVNFLNCYLFYYTFNPHLPTGYTSTVSPSPYSIINSLIGHSPVDCNLLFVAFTLLLLGGLRLICGASPVYRNLSNHFPPLQSEKERLFISIDACENSSSWKLVRSKFPSNLDLALLHYL